MLRLEVFILVLLSPISNTFLHFGQAIVIRFLNAEFLKLLELIGLFKMNMEM